MSIKKLLPLLILIPFLTGNLFQPSLANSTSSQISNYLLQPTTTKTVCAVGCDHAKIQDAINDSDADIIQLSSQTFQESIIVDRDVSIIGAGLENSIIQAASDQGIATSRVITVTNGVSVTLNGVTIRHGVATGSGTDAYGGGIFNQGTLRIQNCLVTLNTSDYGGGIANGVGAGLASTTITNSSIQSNEATYSGAGIFNEATANGTTSTITMTHSTISNNSTETGGGVANIAGNGAASFVFSKSTISGNSVDSSGGGLFNEVRNNGSAIANINQSTFSQNSGGNIYNNNGTIQISQSIVAKSPGENADCENIGTIGTVIDDGFNHVQDGTCGFLAAGDPILGNLADNGGDTQTHALQPGSSALDIIPPDHCETSVDQRGISRPFGAGCDIGAFELNTIDLEMAQNVSDENVIPGQLITFTVQISPIGPGISSGVISATVPEELSIQWPIQLDPPDAGTVGEPPILAHSLFITANHRLTMTMATEVSLGLPGDTDLNNIVSFFSTEIITPRVTTVTIHINNASPIAVDDDGALYETNHNTIFTTGNVLENDSDPNGDPLIIVGTNTSNLLGSLTPLGVEPGKLFGNGTFLYDPEGQFNNLPPNGTAIDSFTYEISDGQPGQFVQATVTILIRNDTNRVYLPLLIKGN